MIHIYNLSFTPVYSNIILSARDQYKINNMVLCFLLFHQTFNIWWSVLYPRSTLELGLATISAVRMVRWDQGLAL